MSVMVLDIQLFQEIYSHAMYRDELKHIEHLEKHLKVLAKANILSYDGKYPESATLEQIREDLEYIEKTKLDYTGHVFSRFQILTWVKCIKYNIKIEFLSEKIKEVTIKALAELRYIEDVLVNSILIEIPEYRNCEWASIPKETA